MYFTVGGIGGSYSLIFLSTVVDYFVGLKIDDSSDKKK